LNTTGIILDGDLKVGTFEDVTTDGVIRQLKNVRINEKYVDVAKGQTNRDLMYLYVIQQDMSMIILECVGLGLAYGEMWCQPPYVEIHDANFVKAPEKSNAN
jgi:hypothetical protein